MFTSDSQHPPRSKHAVYLGAYETFSLHLQNSIRDGEVGNYLFLTDVRIQREIGGLDTPPPN